MAKAKANKNSRLKTLVIIMALAVAVFGVANFAINYYTNNSYMTLNGDRHVEVGLNGLYEDPGAKAVIAGFDASSLVDTEGKVDTSTPGTYKVTYSCGHFNVSRTIKVLDHMSPEVALLGEESYTVKLPEIFQDPGCAAIDEDGNNITDSVKITGNDFRKAGVHNVKYTATDSKGRSTQITRKVTVEPNKKYKTPGIAICMYHYVYDEKDPPADLHDRWGNYIGAAALTEEINWLKSEDYYFPTWKEIRMYVDGEMVLPEKSVVLTFDDCSKTFLKYGIPVLEKCQVTATSFVITSQDGEKKMAEYPSKYVDYESHSDNMHRGGGNIGHGGIFTAISHDAGLADLQKSIDIVGNNKAFAYPYGDYNASAISIVKEAGFLCAVTTQPGRIHPGDNPYLLNRQRMSLDQSLKSFQDKVKPN